MRPYLYLFSKVGILLFLIIMCSSTIKSDLPVHCKREQIEGEWIFRINTDIFNPDLNDFKTSCGHGFPDKIEKIVGDVNYSFESFRDVSLILSKDYKIYEPNSSNVVGKWTPVYDEGFIVYYRNTVFTAFMKYYLKQKTSAPKPSNNLYMSNCDKTMIGWAVHDQAQNDKNWSCFFGFKSKIQNEFKSNMKNFLKPNQKFNKFEYVKNQSSNSNENSNGDEAFESGQNSNGDFDLNFFGSDNDDEADARVLDSFLEIKMRNKSNMQMKLWMSRYEEQMEIINEINNSDLSWKAHINDEFRGLSFIELKNKMGIKKNKISNSDFFNNYLITKDFNGNGNSGFASDNIDNELNDDFKVSSFNKNTGQKSINANNYNPNLNDPLDFDAFGNVNLLNLNEQNISNSVSENNFKNNFKPNSDLSSNYFNSDLHKQGNLDGNFNNNRDRDGNLETDYSVVSKYLHKELDEMDENTLPKNWDWRNIGGINYVPHPRKQGDCGSCYVFSIVSSLESRLRILTNNQDKTEFSRQFPVSCSFYTEGCEGGYPILVAKFFNEFEIVPESCLEYQAKNAKCSDVCDYKQNPIKYYVSKYEYLGGFYGATNEVAIMKELRARGPIPGNMTVPWSFSYYKSGIYSDKTLKKNSGKLSKTTLLDKNLSWSSVDHSILLVGYGEENGTKYWIGMNTWGTNWGENGFFKILRGENDCNIETMGDAARIAFKKRN